MTKKAVMDDGERDFYQRIGGYMAAARRSKGLTQRDVGRVVCLTASAISFIESGRSRPSLLTFEHLCDLLGLSSVDVFAVGTGKRLLAPAESDSEGDSDG